MSEARWGKRFSTELRSSFGDRHPDLSGVIRNVSPFGLQISGSKIFPERTRLLVRFATHNHEPVLLEAEVRWNYQVREYLQTKGFSNCGMGLTITRFLEGEHHFQDLCYKLCKDRAESRRPAYTLN